MSDRAAQVRRERRGRRQEAALVEVPGSWSEREAPGYRLVAALLWSGEQEVLDNHDATWASYSEIRLTAGQVDQLRDDWRRHGVPPDLYVPGRSRADRHQDEASGHGTAHG